MSFRLPADLSARVAAYAMKHDLTRTAAIVNLLTLALQSLDLRASGGHARAAAMSKAQRSASARKAALAKAAQRKLEREE